MSKVVKLFIGYPITSDIRMYLKQSTSWQHVKITTEISARDLQETHYQEKDYIGKYINDSKQTLEDLKHIENSIQTALTHYCPELAGETLKIHIFPQIFIS